MKDKIVEKDLSYRLGGIFFKIQKNLGRFCRERQYADMFAQELKEAGINFQREEAIEIANRKSNFADFIIEGRAIVDLKAKPFLEKEDFHQMKRYLEISGKELGLIVNFQDKYLKPKRILNSKDFVDSDKFVVLNRDGGFTVIELLIVMGVIATLSVVSLAVLFNRRSRQELDNNARQIVALLREAQSRSAAQEGSTTWGVHFDNSVNPAFYALFKTAYSSTSTVGRYPLPSSLRFSTSSISSGSTLDITFAQISGTPSTSTTVTLELFTGGGGSSGASVSRSAAGKIFFDDFNRSNL